MKVNKRDKAGTTLKSNVSPLPVPVDVFAHTLSLPFPVSTVLSCHYFNAGITVPYTLNGPLHVIIGPVFF